MSMTDERAVQLVKWGPCYASPKPKNPAEYQAACDHVATNPDLYNECWQTSIRERYMP